jgi:hypothetical protein
MTEQNDTDAGRALWDATSVRPLLPFVSPTIRGEKPTDKPTDEKRGGQLNAWQSHVPRRLAAWGEWC